MANWIDLFSLFATISVFAGIIYGVIYVVNSVSQGVASTKEALAHKGLVISDKGMSVKTSKRFDREDYVDATQSHERRLVRHRDQYVVPFNPRIHQTF
ncbi:hypothetical protein ONZ45_g4987 [Pleurotus djamor]|nr:hypothetical protein ONZ45_g16180 [Pleurotus djamor]KAJ8517872.1 hypothetical protein ONZ45_g4987 [Pleurotus djamor]